MEYERCDHHGVLNTGDYWVPDVLNTLKKLKISCIGGKWRLNEVTKAQKELFGALGVNIQ